MQYYQPDPVPNHRALIGYTSVHFGKSLLWAGEDALTLYILIRYLDLPPAVAGAIFLSSALWNALCDGLFAVALLRWPAIWRWLPWIIIPAILGATVGFSLLPWVAQGSSIASIVLLFLFRTCFCLVDIPHNALTRNFAAQYGHLMMARVRSFTAAGAALIIGLVGFAIAQHGAMAQIILQGLIVFIGASACILMLPLPVILASQTPDYHRTEKSPLRAMASANRSLWLYCLATLIGVGSLAAMAKAILHLEFQAEMLGTAALLLMTIGRIAAIWLWTPLARIIGARPALALSYTLAGLAILCLPTVAQMTAIPLIFSLVLYGVTGGGIAFLTWAVLTETMDHEADITRQAAGFGLFTMSMKIGLGISAMLVGWWLSMHNTTYIASGETIFTLSLWITMLTLIAALLVMLTDIRTTPRCARN